MLDKLTKESFSEHLNQRFQMQVDEATSVEIELVEVKALTPAPKASGFPKVKLREAPFSIVFRGPHQPVYRQRMYTIKHHEMGTIEGLFLVPLGGDQDGMYYQAVFS